MAKERVLTFKDSMGRNREILFLPNFQVEVVFHNDKSIWEIFQRQDRVIETADAKAILKANAAGGRTWHHARLNRRWERSGEPLCLGYHWPGHEDYFCVEDVKACEVIQKSDAADLKGLTELANAYRSSRSNMRDDARSKKSAQIAPQPDCPSEKLE